MYNASDLSVLLQFALTALSESIDIIFMKLISIDSGVARKNILPRQSLYIITGFCD